MGFLDGELATSIYRGFKGRMLTGVLRKHTEPDSGGLDELGDPLDIASTDTAIEGFVEDYDDAYRNKAGIPGTDLRVQIFAKSCPGVTPEKDDVARVRWQGVDAWYQLRRVQTDPAKALWTCQAFEIPAPS